MKLEGEVGKLVRMCDKDDVEGGEVEGNKRSLDHMGTSVVGWTLEAIRSIPAVVD